jgi:sortase A
MRRNFSTLISPGAPGDTSHTMRRWINRASVILFVVGLLMLGKSSWITLKAEVAQVLLQRAFAQSIATGQPVKAWGWADTWPVGKLEIARLGASAIILHGSSGEAMAFGPGLMHETAKPGERGTAVIAAHRDTHFAFLEHAKRGDIITITRNDGLTFTYTITTLRVANWNQSGIDRHRPGFHLVLATCWPFGGISSGPQRYIVEAEMTG